MTDRELTIKHSDLEETARTIELEAAQEDYTILGAGDLPDFGKKKKIIEVRDIRRIGVPLLHEIYKGSFERGQKASPILREALINYFQENLGYTPDRSKDPSYLVKIDDEGESK